MPEDRLLEDYANYGALKALAEQAVAETFPDAYAHVRPGLIVGPHDPTGRFTYWPHRVAGAETSPPRRRRTSASSSSTSATSPSGWSASASGVRAGS